MKQLLLTALGLSLCISAATGSPKVLTDYLTPNSPVKGEIVVVVPPEEIDTYIKKVEENAQSDPEWFESYSKNAKPGVPLPFHEKLGLSKAEYEEYLKLWDSRKMEPVPQGQVVVRLEEADPGVWMIRVSGLGSDLTTIRYHADKDLFKSINGTLERLEDINADKQTILGAWTGHEWKLEKEDSFGVTKENIAIGKLADGSYGLIVYRLQEVSSAGRRIFDKSMVIRFAIKRS